ncbi:Hypothetical protein LUCI_0883 [Lucifera butyrica]|uniref:BTB domain-containing protein n=1 Tax=Lucifera butyrica TaxID=1351585 RepID=A0A498R637_9FIRM|nr:DUF4127 family protein [Lucifera butyrica]VBB05673.1 Hypothetical protein LUCI_0883 [Lucifera butyrica]
MLKKIIVFIFLFLAGLTIIFPFGKHTGRHTGITQSVSPAQSTKPMRILLMPLDSRPACTQFVQQLAGLAQATIIMPPAELMDSYTRPANRPALREWLSRNCPKADAAIVSTDMLIHGGLLASRLPVGTEADRQAAINTLAAIHQDNPRLPVYAFTIIPRLIIADNRSNGLYRDKMLRYSILKDEIACFENPLDIAEFSNLEKQLPSRLLNRYLTMYQQNTLTNLRLANMLKNQLLAGLVVGQDDSQPFGIPNINREIIQHYLDQRPQLANSLFITRGTDEVAVTLLGYSLMKNYRQRPRIKVIYSQPTAPQQIMPYMPCSVARCVEEKIALIRGIQVENPAEADFILYVHIGTPTTNHRDLLTAAQEVQSLLQHGYKVALVDLGETFQASETLLPYLLSVHADIARLIAYAGWNTASNSIGTALTQAAIFSLALKRSPDSAATLLLYKKNLEFLSNRILEDWYYQKNTEPRINKKLRELGIDPNHLDEHYEPVQAQIQSEMAANAQTLFQTAFYQRPFPIQTTAGEKKVVITSLTLKTELPWPRTFELRLEPRLSLSECR